MSVTMDQSSQQTLSAVAQQHRLECEMTKHQIEELKIDLGNIKELNHKQKEALTAADEKGKAMHGLFSLVSQELYKMQLQSNVNEQRTDAFMRQLQVMSEGKDKLDLALGDIKSQLNKARNTSQESQNHA